MFGLEIRDKRLDKAPVIERDIEQWPLTPALSGNFRSRYVMARAQNAWESNSAVSALVYKPSSSRPLRSHTPFPAISHLEILSALSFRLSLYVLLLSPTYTSLISCASFTIDISLGYFESLFLASDAHLRLHSFLAVTNARQSGFITRSPSSSAAGRRGLHQQVSA